MSTRITVVVAVLAAAVGACSPPSSGSPPAGSPDTGTPAGGTPGGGVPPGGEVPPDGGAGVTQPPGTTQPSSSGGSASLQVGANAGPGGALFYNDHPALGEARVSGLVVVRKSDGSPTPADTVVTLNGVDLVHAVLGGTPSPNHFTVDPAGAQPTISADGFLYLTVSSASAGLTRTLALACPAAVALTLTPSPGSSLAGVSSVGLDWTPALPVQGRDFSAFGLAPPSASLHGFDPATGEMSFVGSPVLVAPGALSATVPVAATAAPAYAVELRYPGVFFLDGETGGACGRTQRLLYSK